MGRCFSGETPIRCSPEKKVDMFHSKMFPKELDYLLKFPI